MVNVGNGTIEVRFWGVRGSIPCPGSAYVKFGGNTSCVQISIDGLDDYIILDSGSGIRPLGEFISSSKSSTRGHLFVTHAHWDHIQGFPFFNPIYQRDFVLDIYYPKTKDGDCRRAMTAQLTPNHFPVTSEMLEAQIQYHDINQTGMQSSTFQVDYHNAFHPVHTAIFRLRTPSRTVVYAPDNELNPEKVNVKSFKQLQSFIHGADVLIHDGNYDRSSYKMRRNWGHSAWEDVVDLAADCGIKHLFLTHHDPQSSDDDMLIRQELLDKHKHKFTSVQFAREGNAFSI
jgi:phosphoribosyl 1,2-cyclic phosphodiesterase